MTTSAASGSEAPGGAELSPEEAGAAALARLHPDVARWVWEQGWTELRSTQTAAFAPILAGDIDVIISAATASGKTEAAYLPICSALATTGPSPGISVLYVSPLKALINDQFDRLDRLCEHLGIPVHRWHGDVPGAKKAKLLDAPSGMLLITPESLEALFVLRGSQIGTLLGGLRYVVLDELHSFMGTERGAQLQSLVHRVELAVRRRVPRIALSATLGDMGLAAEFLRPGAGKDIRLIVADDGAQVRLAVRGYRITAPRLDGPALQAALEAGDEVTSEDTAEGNELAIAGHLFETLRGSDNLIFTNSRAEVEVYADLLTRRSEKAMVPNEFVAHHGSLSKEFREDVETRLKDRTRPVNAVCTSTLELGIDIGDVRSIAQIGAPPSVATTRQRLGRSGRRGDPAVLRCYISEPEITARTSPPDALRADLVQTVAMVNLLLTRWYEPPATGELHLSTLVQQLLSVIAQHGGVQPAEAYSALCGSGPFANISAAQFAGLLRALGANEVITQSADGLLLLDLRGEQIVNHYSFYAAFSTPQQWRLVSGGRQLGTLPISDRQPLRPGSLILFAGRRWRIVGIDPGARVVDLVAAPGGRPPRFHGTGALVHDRVRQEMLAVYRDSSVPGYLDATAAELLTEGRQYFACHGLDHRAVIDDGPESYVFPWAGDRVLATLAAAVTAEGLDASVAGLALAVVGADAVDITNLFHQLARRSPPDPVELAAVVANKIAEKYDQLLPDELLAAGYAARTFDCPGAWEFLLQFA
jgi:ATP-dependent helicase Lhr and Lhr-like helicase